MWYLKCPPDCHKELTELTEPTELTSSGEPSELLRSCRVTLEEIRQALKDAEHVSASGTINEAGSKVFVRPEQWKEVEAALEEMRDAC